MCSFRVDSLSRRVLGQGRDEPRGRGQEQYTTCLRRVRVYVLLGVSSLLDVLLRLVYSIEVWGFFFYFFFSFYDLCTMAGLCFVLVSEAGPLHLISWSEGKGLDADCTVRDQENHYPCVMKTCPASLHPTEVQDLEATSATTL